MGGIAGKAALADLPEGVQVDSVHFGFVASFRPPLVSSSSHSIRRYVEEYCTLILRRLISLDTLVT